jgi:hypothetical protein
MNTNDTNTLDGMLAQAAARIRAIEARLSELRAEKTKLNQERHELTRLAKKHS